MKKKTLDESCLSQIKLGKSEKMSAPFKIIESHLLAKAYEPGANEGDGNQWLAFWCGEEYGMIKVDVGLLFLTAKKGETFYIIARYSAENNRYVGEKCFSARKYTLSEDFEKKLIRIPYEEYERKAKLNSK